MSLGQIQGDVVANAPVILDFPLRGEWFAPTTPAKRVPSHGTDKFGLTYAFDFVRPDPNSKSLKFYSTSVMRYLIRGVRLNQCFGWGQPIFAPVAGNVVRAEDGMQEREPVHPVRDTAIMLKFGYTFDLEKNSPRELLGNYVILESSVGYAVFAHAQTGSVKVTVGERVSVGQHLANVGHSGNSTAPHLHFHLMDSMDFGETQGILCAFREYEALREGVWQTVRDGIPKDMERIRKLE
jgi:murein DD-endopeptidase MepM/ murein hydrolase activator NlpD